MDLKTISISLVHTVLVYTLVVRFSNLVPVYHDVLVRFVQPCSQCPVIQPQCILVWTLGPTRMTTVATLRQCDLGLPYHAG